MLLALAVCAAAPLPVVWHGSTEIASGRGERGPWRQNDSRFDYVDDPAVALDNSGRIALVWVEQARKDVLFQRSAADGTLQAGKAVNVSRNPATFSWLPRVVIAPHAPQHIFILWQEIIFSGGSHGGEIFFARSEDGGATFSAPLNLSNSPGGDGKGRINKEIWDNGSYDLAAGSDGTLHATWTEYGGALWCSRSTDGGKSFSRPQRIAGGGNETPVRGPALAVGDNHTVYLAWTNGDDAHARIHVARSENGGKTFAPPLVIASGKGYSDAPKLAIDRTGVVHLVFAQSNTGPFGRYRVQYARSRDGARSFESLRDISAPLPEGMDSASFPAIATDGAGNVYVTWEWFPVRSRRARGLGMTVSLDAGRSFLAPQLVPGSIAPEGGSNGSQQGLLMKKLAVNDAGAVAIVNSSLKENERSRVWLLRGSLAKRP